MYYDNPFETDSYDYQEASNGLWQASIDFDSLRDDAWIDGDTQSALEFDQLSSYAEWLSNEAYEDAWDAWYGPVNSEGYTAYDAAMGYSSTDTSFIEPASSAASCSLISDNSASYL